MGRPDLPALISAYLERCVPPGWATAAETLLEQRGEMRLAPDKGWMPFSAEQRISARETRFVWHARFTMAPFVTGVVEDAFEGGRGRLDARIWGVLPVARGRGLEVDRGEAQRYLAELPWCPMALAANEGLGFREVAERVVRVWSGDDESTAVDLRFDAAGDLVGSRCGARPRHGVDQAWEGRFWDFRPFEGLRAPARAEVWWDPPEGRFVYWRGEVTALRPATEGEA